MRRRDIKRRILNFSLLVGLILGLGSTALWFVLPLIELSQSTRGWVHGVTTLAMCALIGTPGMLLLYALKNLRDEADRTTIKNFCGIFYGMLMLVVGFLLLPMWLIYPLGVEPTLGTSGSLFVAIAGLLPIYVAHTKALMRESGIEPQPGEYFGRYTLGLLGFLLMTCLMNLARMTGMMDSPVSDDRGVRMLTTFLFVLIIPLVGYRLSVRWLLPASAKAE